MSDEKMFIICGSKFKLPEPPSSPIFPWDNKKDPIKPRKRILKRRVRRTIAK